VSEAEYRPRQVARWRAVAALLLVGGLLVFSGYIFWLQDWKYGLPTPKPQGLQQLPIGSHPALPPVLASLRVQAPGQPLFLHFFNPDCPCSRFNADHVRELIRAHRATTSFVAIVEPEGGTLARDEVGKVEREFGIHAVVDENGAIGRAVGVYSTPQAVIVGPEGSLYFRGNYNVSRYCADARSEYARLALEHVLAGASFEAPEGATVAYGCELPARAGRSRPRANP
jgi:hypothetical protein